MVAKWGAARAIGAAVFISIVAGCSSADYAAPIKTFADATTAADTALADFNKTANESYEAALSQRARTDSGIVVDARDDECLERSSRCRIALEDTSVHGKIRNFPPDPLLGRSVALMGDIKTYAQNLATLVADDSAAQAAPHVNAALGSIEKLAIAVAEADGKPKGSVPSFATPVGPAVNWVVGKYAEHVKLAGLRDATKTADPVIQRAAALFEKEAVFGSQIRRDALAAVFRVKMRAYQADRGDAAKLNEAVAAAKTYDDFLKAQPEMTFKTMGAAHAALTAALNNSDISWPQAIAKIQEFAAEAQQLAQIAQDLTALTQKK